MNLDELDDLVGDGPMKINKVIRAPFNYHGSKRRSIEHIMPHLPHLDVWVDVFGGSGVVTLNREPAKKLDVYNDRWSGVTVFFRCIRDPAKCDEMIEQLSLMPHSKEEFYECKKWEVGNDVQRAVRWYYMLQTSYGAVGRNWGFGLTTRFGRKFRENLKMFPAISKRFLDVQIENDDFRNIFKRYDSLRTVFYCDPPYFDSHQAGSYIHKFSEQDHIDLLELIRETKGFVAVSNYKNKLYDSYGWDEFVQWKIRGGSHGGATESNHRIGAKISAIRDECLYIKDVS